MQPSPFYTPFSSPFLTPPPFLPPSLPNLALGMRTRLSASHLTRSSHGLLTQFPPASQGSLRSPVQKTAAGENKESKGRSRLKWRRQIMPWLQTRREVGTATDAFLPKPPQTAHASISANAFTCARFSAQEGGMQGNTARTWWCKSVPLFCLVVPSSKWRCTKENSSRIWTIYDSKMLIKKKGIATDQIFCTTSLNMFFQSRLKTKQSKFISEPSAVPLRYLVCARFLLKALELDDKRLCRLSLTKQVQHSWVPP